MGPRELKHNVISETKMRKALTISLLQAKQLYQTDAYLYCFSISQWRSLWVWTMIIFFHRFLNFFFMLVPKENMESFQKRGWSLRWQQPCKNMPAELQTLIMTAVSNYYTTLWETWYYVNKLQLHFMTVHTIFIKKFKTLFIWKNNPSLTVFRINQRYSIIESNNLIQYKCWNTLKCSLR